MSALKRPLCWKRMCVCVCVCNVHTNGLQIFTTKNEIELAVQLLVNELTWLFLGTICNYHITLTVHCGVFSERKTPNTLALLSCLSSFSSCCFTAPPFLCHLFSVSFWHLYAYTKTGGKNHNVICICFVYVCVWAWLCAYTWVYVCIYVVVYVCNKSQKLLQTTI